MRDYKLYLKDILDAILAIEKFINNINVDEFKDNDEKSSAVIRKFEIIGEASKNIPEEIKEKYNQIPWREIAGFRDKLIHFYFGIDYELVWSTIKNRLPIVKNYILEILNELNKNK